MMRALLCLFAIAATVVMLAPGDLLADDEGTVITSQFDIDSDSRDREGLNRDTWYFLGYQWVTIGVLYMAPESVSSWSDEQKNEYSLSTWWHNVTHPQMDPDDFYLNYMLHPYWGASYYVRSRERGFDDRESFWYSALLSTTYECGAEALFEEVSIQDLIITPVVGSLLGRYLMNVRDDIRSREMELGYRTRGDKWLWVMTDPLGSLNEQVDKLVGHKTSLQIRPYRYVRRPHAATPFEPVVQDGDTVYGLEFRLEW